MARLWLVGLVVSVMLASGGYVFGAVWLMVLAGVVVLVSLVLLAMSTQGPDEKE